MGNIAPVKKFRLFQLFPEKLPDDRKRRNNRLFSLLSVGFYGSEDTRFSVSVKYLLFRLAKIRADDFLFILENGEGRKCLSRSGRTQVDSTGSSRPRPREFFSTG